MNVLDKLKNIPIPLAWKPLLRQLVFVMVIIGALALTTKYLYQKQQPVPAKPPAEVTLSVRYNGSERWFTDSIEIGKNLAIQSAFSLYVSSEAIFNLGTAEKPKPHIDGSKVVVTCDGRKVFEMSVHASSLDTWAFTAYCSGNEYRLSRGVQKDFYDLPASDRTVNQILELRKD